MECVLLRVLNDGSAGMAVEWGSFGRLFGLLRGCEHGCEGGSGVLGPHEVFSDECDVEACVFEGLEVLVGADA